ncbi:MAG: glycoside hydrolase family 5 protein [Phycisphaerae bacterium]|nr:glycoside hydrolase family 5 protein [Phycisphaerae bacterium]
MNKKPYNLIVWLTLVMSMVSLSTDGAELTLSGRWSADKARQWYQGQPWLVGCDFTPSTAINQLEMWQADTFDLKTIDRELGWAADMGMNTVRVYLHDLLWQQDRDGFLKRIDQFLGIADKHGIKTMLVLCDAVWNPHPKPGKQPEPKPHLHNSGWVQSPHIDILKDITSHKTLEPYFKGVIGRFKDDKRVLLWDLYNEPGNDRKEDGMTTKEKEAVCLILLEKMFTWAREVNPSQPLTTGLWNKEWVGPNVSSLNEFIAANSDVISFHSYEALSRTTERVGSIRPFGRPLLCTEYLARATGSKFQTHLPYFKKNKIAAYNWGFVAGKIQTQYPWSSWQKKFTAEPTIWHHDVLRPDGTPFDTSEVELIRSLTKGAFKH